MNASVNGEGAFAGLGGMRHVAKVGEQFRGFTYLPAMAHSNFLLAGAFAGIFAGSGAAQTSLTQAVDFTVTDIHGVEHTLFEYLDAGKYVCLDFLFTTCGPCQANQPYFTETYHNFGCNTGDVILLSLETTVGDAETAAYEETFGGENPPPIASCTDGGACTAASPYGISAFPTFILIAPDGEIVNQDIWPLSNGAATFTALFESYGIQQMACAVGVEDRASATPALRVFPNPASTAARLDLSGLTGTVEVRVYDAAGRQVHREQAAGGTALALSTEAWPAGLCTVVAEANGERHRTVLAIVH